MKYCTFQHSFDADEFLYTMIDTLKDEMFCIIPKNLKEGMLFLFKRKQEDDESVLCVYVGRSAKK